jgi:hypothetical protein
MSRYEVNGEPGWGISEWEYRHRNSIFPLKIINYTIYRYPAPTFSNKNVKKYQIRRNLEN